MSYESKLDHIDHKSGKLINPAQLCLLISIGLHLLVLKFGLPTLKFNDDSSRREVSIIELNPEQQARLPDLYPQLDTPNISIPDISDLPPLDNSEPASPFAIPRNLIPGIGNPGDLVPLIIPPPPNFDNLPPITDITLPPIGDISSLPLPPEISPEDFQIDPAVKPNTPPTTEEPAKPTSPETNPAKPPNQATKPQNKPETSPQNTQPEVKQTPEQIAARKAADSQQRIRNLSQSLKKDETGTSDEEARKNYIEWLTKVQDIEPQSIEVKGTYPRDACIRRLEGTSVYGVVVDSSGKVVALDLIKGAQYPIFNEKAGEEIAKSVLENDEEKPKPYQVTVNYEYDSEICPSLTLPSIRRKEEQEKIESVPAPKPETKPEPEPGPAAAPIPEPESEPKSEPEQVPAPTPKLESESKPQPKPLPSLRDRLRNIPLPDRKPADFRNTPLPSKSDFN